MDIWTVLAYWIWKYVQTFKLSPSEDMDLASSVLTTKVWGEGFVRMHAFLWYICTADTGWLQDRAACNEKWPAISGENACCGKAVFCSSLLRAKGRVFMVWRATRKHYFLVECVQGCRKSKGQARLWAMLCEHHIVLHGHFIWTPLSVPDRPKPLKPGKHFWLGAGEWFSWNPRDHPIAQASSPASAWRLGFEDTWPFSLHDWMDWDLNMPSPLPSHYCRPWRWTVFSMKPREKFSSHCLISAAAMVYKHKHCFPAVPILPVKVSRRSPATKRAWMAHGEALT